MVARDGTLAAGAFAPAAPAANGCKITPSIGAELRAPCPIHSPTVCTTEQELTLGRLWLQADTTND